MTQILVKLKRKYLIMIITNILPLKNLIELTADHFTAKLKEAKLETKNDIADFVKEIDFDKKLK